MSGRIGIFGGSFDPIHLGHVGVAERAAAELGLDMVLVTPAKVSPFKTGAGPRLDDETRWRLVQMACRGREKLVPWDAELRRGGVSYAIDTVRLVREMHPGAEVFFIIGEDSVEGLPRWREWEELKKLCEFAAYPRTVESSTEIRRRLAAGEPVDDLAGAEVAAELERLTR